MALRLKGASVPGDPREFSLLVTTHVMISQGRPSMDMVNDDGTIAV